MMISDKIINSEETIRTFREAIFKSFKNGERLITLPTDAVRDVILSAEQKTHQDEIELTLKTMKLLEEEEDVAYGQRWTDLKRMLTKELRRLKTKKDSDKK